MNDKAQARLYKLYLALIEEVKRAPPRSQVRLEVNIDAQGHLSGKVYPAPVVPE